MACIQISIVKFCAKFIRIIFIKTIMLEIGKTNSLSDLNLFVFRNKCTYCGSDIETSFTPIGRRILWWLIQTKIFAFFRNTECHSLLPARYCNLLFSEGKKMCVLRQSCHMKKEILLKHQSAQTFFIFYFPCFLALCNYCIYMFKRQFLIEFQFKN